MTACLEFYCIDSFYGGAHVLHGVSMSIEEGECVALIGRNGVGKTTLVNSVLGVATIRRGEMRFLGRRIAKPRPFTAALTGIGIVPQGRQIVENLSIEENLILGAAAGRRGSWSLDRVYHLFPILRERKRTLGTALSGGQQQMLAIGRALMGNPSCLILDEPSEGLAPVVIDEIAAVAKTIAIEGTAILLIEQNLGVVRRLAKRYCVLAKGAITREGTMDATGVAELTSYIAV
jgi:ABC-type branched-subunit amino acid transport system ATPase component